MSGGRETEDGDLMPLFGVKCQQFVKWSKRAVITWGWCLWVTPKGVKGSDGFSYLPKKKNWFPCVKSQNWKHRVCPNLSTIDIFGNVSFFNLLLHFFQPLSTGFLHVKAKEHCTTHEERMIKRTCVTQSQPGNIWWAIVFQWWICSHCHFLLPLLITCQMLSLILFISYEKYTWD